MSKSLQYIKTFCTLVIMLLAYTNGNAQTEPMYSQYMYNMLGVNPAYAGSREASSFNLFQRRQWVGLQGAPQTTSVSIDQSMLDKRAGWGIQLYDDKLGVEKADGINLMASTRIRVSENGILSGGLSFGVMNYRIDLMNVTGRYTPSDPAFYTNFNKWLPSVGLGLYYNTDNFYAGVSIPNLLKSRLTAFDVMRSGLQKVNKKHIFLTTGMVFAISDDIKLKPSTMIKMVEGAPIEADLNTNVWLREIIGLGVSYRTGDAVIGMAEIQVNENLRFGYGYDVTISPLKYYNNGSHEIMIRYEFGNFKTKIKSTRYF
ncbi:MAG: type IX secretion system membrane protein PorP/SprF [Bacteroidetes bacterium]|nr:type IX secretion system membrane protein PorP/SprF [Bacteroidota bacterium]